MKTIFLLLTVAVWPNPAAQAPTVAEKNAPSTITIAARDEPGEQLIT